MGGYVRRVLRLVFCGGVFPLVLACYTRDVLPKKRAAVYLGARIDCATNDVSYVLEHVVDYYPYGKVLREWVNCERARYLTTYHERDIETGYDYRGARFPRPPKQPVTLRRRVRQRSGAVFVG